MARAHSSLLLSPSSHPACSSTAGRWVRFAATCQCLRPAPHVLRSQTFTALRHTPRTAIPPPSHCHRLRPAHATDADASTSLPALATIAPSSLHYHRPLTLTQHPTVVARPYPPNRQPHLPSLLPSSLFYSSFFFLELEKNRVSSSHPLAKSTVLASPFSNHLSPKMSHLPSHLLRLSLPGTMASTAGS